MIFPEKPRAPWTGAETRVRVQPPSPVQPQGKAKVPLPPGYWRERIELTAIIIGMVFWIKFWLEFK
jgi:hypothetical protein